MIFHLYQVVIAHETIDIRSDAIVLVYLPNIEFDAHGRMAPGKLKRKSR